VIAKAQPPGAPANGGYRSSGVGLRLVFRWALSVLLIGLAVLCGVAVAGSLAISAPDRGGPLRAFTAGSLERIRATGPERGLSVAKLTAARGETESFQVAVRGPAHGVTASMGALAGPEGAIIPAAAVALYREQDVLVEHSTPYPGGPNPPDPPGAIPDALIPFSAPGGELRAQPFDVAPGGNAVLFADLTVPRSARPGSYSGVLTLRAPGRRSLAVSVSLTVWSFALPSQPTLGSSFGIWDVPRRQASQLLLENRLQPGAVLARDVRALRPLGLTAAGLPFWSGADATTCSFDSPPSVSQVQRAVRGIGRGLRLYDYTADETDGCSDAVDSLRAWGRALHAAGVAQLATVTPSPALMDDGTGRPAVDIWALGPSMMAAAAPYLPALRAAGGEIWTYTALVPDPAAPIWTLDEPLINERILPGFLGRALGATGVLYWRIDAFGAGDVWTTAESSESGGEQYPGDGQLVYPGQEVGVDGVVPSLRLKALRDGEEDYELLGLAQRAGVGSQANAIARSVATSWDAWSRDPGELERARLRIGNLVARALRP
jgi:hypothetical protein